MASRYSTRPREFLGLKYLNIKPSEVQTEILRKLDGNFFYAVTPNAQHIVLLNKDRSLQSAYSAADIVLNDSRIISRLAKLSGILLHANPGSDLTLNLLNALNKRSAIVTIVGPDRVIIPMLRSKYPKIKFEVITAQYNLRSNREAVLRLAEECNALNWDVLFICLGCPVQEQVALLIKKMGRRNGFALCAGASIDFIVGYQRRAPIWMQRLSLEWLFRLMTNPLRLWRRYLLDSPKVLKIWAERELMKKKYNP